MERTTGQMPAKRSSVMPVSGRLSPAGGLARNADRGSYLGIFFLAAALFLFFSLFSYDPRDVSFNVATSRGQVSNLCGLIGSHVADAMVQLTGIASLFLPVCVMVLAARLLVGRRLRAPWVEAGWIILLISVTASLLERSGMGPVLSFPLDHPGGAIGALIHSKFFKFFGSAGEILLGSTIVVLAALCVSNLSVQTVIRSAQAALAAGAKMAAWAWDRLKAAHLRYRQREAESVEIAYVSAPVIVWEDDQEPEAKPSVGKPETEDGASSGHRFRGAAWERLSVLPREDWLGVHPEWWDPVTEEFRFSEEDSETEPPLSSRQSAETAPPVSKRSRGRKDQTEAETDLDAAIDECIREHKASLAQAAVGLAAESLPAETKEKSKPIHVTRRADEGIPRAEKRAINTSPDDEYQLPSSDLLDPPPVSGRSVDEKLLSRNAAILEQKLGDLGIRGEVVAIHPGPVITMYELTLAPGIPLRKVLNTGDDLAMALKSGSTRVVAPIPGKDTVGIEVPNLHREIVFLREVIESPSFIESEAPLRMALGKGIDGEPFTTDLTRMPHLLIAGATGTGKSVGLNCLICSWLMSCHPDDLKLLLVDPKKLELSHYHDIPHLLHPVVTEAEKVPAVLSWAIREMERRYDLLSAAGARDIAGYNERLRAGELSAGPDGAPPVKLPFIVIIVDELAELMMVAAKDIEISIARLAQMARASGIHLILATQRPSVDVITGVIKANFPARLSYQVSARADSRTILDTSGAESLLGMGDMLFLPPGASKMRRLHGAYISEHEIGRICDFIKQQRAPVYLKEISRHVSSEDSRTNGSDLVQEDKYDEAVELVSRIGHASISLIQRHLRIGYNRAARIIEAMEAEGIVGPSDGTSRPREVLVQSLHHVSDRAGY